MEGYSLNKKLIMKAWARYRPNFSKNNGMFSGRKREDNADLRLDFWDTSFLNNLLS